MIAAGLIMALTISGALLAVAQGNIVRAIFGFAITLAGVALAFLALGSPFVAAMEVLIYIGGITVAMVFAVMLSSAGQKEPTGSFGRHAMAAFVALIFYGGVAYVIVSADFGVKPELDATAWSVQEIGRNLLDRFNVVFELLSVVLLVAIIGAITIAGRSDDADPPAEEDVA